MRGNPRLNWFKFSPVSAKDELPAITFLTFIHLFEPVHEARHKINFNFEFEI